MSLEALANTGEFLGGIGVLLTLVFLIRETRDNTKAVKASSFHAVNLSMAEINMRVADNPELSSLLTRAINPDASKGDFTVEEWSRFGVFCRGFFNHFESIHVQHEQGMLAKDLWQQRMGICNWLVTNVVCWKTWWEEEKQLGMQTEAFVYAVDNAPPMSGVGSYFSSD